MNRFILFACAALLVLAPKLQAQADTAQSPYPTEIQPKRLAAAIIAESSIYLGGMAYLQYVWYKDKERVPFHFYDDNAGYLQIDKFGHAFGAYVESYAGYHWLRHAGVSKKNALIYGGSLGFLLQAPIEVFDGMYEGWGFSWGDVIANASGSAFLIGQEILWDSQPIKFKFSFMRSPYADESNGMLGDNYLESLLYDYNGHTYWLSGGLHHLGWEEHLPKWLNVAVGYSANGMFGEFENKDTWGGVPLPDPPRYRQFLLSLDIDWPDIKTNSKFLNSVLNAMFFIKLPFPALEVNTLGEVKGYWLYF